MNKPPNVNGPRAGTNSDEPPNRVVKSTYRHALPKPNSKPPRESRLEAGRWLDVVGPTGNAVYDTWRLNGARCPLSERGVRG